MEMLSYSNGEEFVCPVCGFPELEEPAYARGAPSHEICPSCGTEFGYDDVHADMNRADIYASLRQQWADTGFRWSGISSDPADRWNPTKQLTQAGLSVPERRSPTGPALLVADVPPRHERRPEVLAVAIHPVNDNFLLRCLGRNQGIVLDTLHPTLEGAKLLACEEFGVDLEAWRHAT
jgi:predicted RNA-binding Zn-ribbon protein involved in translation (DUF1610 family)